MNNQRQPLWSQSWFTQVIKKSRFSVHTIRLKESNEWLYNWGAIRHKSGLFFKVVGSNWKNEKGETYIRPLIEQREIGTLGFLIYQGSKHNKILVQAKIEPGNIGVCQIGPTYQATASNTARVHGGKSPLYKNYFNKDGANIVFESLHSEQGSRFLGKLNLNIMVRTKKLIEPDAFHKWVDVDELINCVDFDNFLNTDSRSVLVCSPWEVLVKRAPFSRIEDSITAQLKKSYETANANKIQKVKSDLEATRSKINDPKVVDLTSLTGWKVSPYGINSKDGTFKINQIAVRAIGREVPAWDQPIIDSKSQGTVVLAGAIIDGVMRFFFVPCAEPGLINKVELNPTITIEPGDSAKPVLPKKSIVLATVKQSDEGGRFFCDVTKYSLVLVPSKNLIKNQNGYWLTLGEIMELLKSGYFTNESRSVLSLLLKWL